MKSLVGQAFGPYQIVARLGSGGSGEVYRATDLRLLRDVAIKVLDGSHVETSRQLTWFQQEARAASSLNHPNIVTVHDIGEHDSTPYIAMELVNGVTLRELLKSGVPKSAVLLNLARQIAEGLAKAHEQGVVHRDLKPENLMLTEDGFVKILDFGLAEFRSRSAAPISELTTLRSSNYLLAGTLGYMSPEQADGKPVDYKSDQFAFGVVLYEMATGFRPFQRPTAFETMAAIIREYPEPVFKLNPSVPLRFSLLVERCLSKDPAERYASTREIAVELGEIRESVALAAHDGKTRLLAVLPFEEIPVGDSCHCFSRGLTEEIRNQLRVVPSLTLLSRYAIRQDKRPSLSKIASQTHADNLIEGSVRLSLGRVRVTAVLVDASSGHSLWTDQYDRELHDPFAIQTDIAKRIAGGLLPLLSSR